MRITCSPLQDLTAGDLMSSDLVLIPREMSLQGAAHLLHQAGISGAPVVDEERRCVGVISSSDFVAWADQANAGVRSRPSADRSVHSAWQVLDEESYGAPRVGDLMTVDPVTASQSMPITRIAQMMVDAHIHRVVVIDEQSRPLGIVSSTDILGALALLDSPPNANRSGPHMTSFGLTQNVI